MKISNTLFIILSITIIDISSRNILVVDLSVVLRSNWTSTYSTHRVESNYECYKLNFLSLTIHTSNLKFCGVRAMKFKIIRIISSKLFKKLKLFQTSFSLHITSWKWQTIGKLSSLFCCHVWKGKEVQIVYTVKSRAVDRSTIQFLSNFGVLLTEMCH